MTKTITQDKTILVLAFAATFIAGAAVFGVFSDYEAEAKPKDPKPPFIDPIFKPINATLAEIQLQLDDLQNDVDAVSAKQVLLASSVDSVDDTVNEIKTNTDTTKSGVNLILEDRGLGTSP